MKLTLLALLVLSTVASAFPVASRFHPPGARGNTRAVVGTWKVKVAPNGTPLDVLIEVAETPACKFAVAVYSTVGGATEILPGFTTNGGLETIFPIEGRGYMVVLGAPNGKSMKGKIVDLLAKKESPAEADLVDASQAVRVESVVAGVNGAAGEYEIEGVKTWLVRAPSLGSLPGHFASHAGTSKFFFCYALDLNGGWGMAFTYSELPIFIVPMADGVPGSRTYYKALNDVTSRHQVSPFQFTTTAKSGESVDFVKP